MTQPDPIELQLDPTGYVTGLQQAGAATKTFDGSLAGTTAALAALPLLMTKVSGHVKLLGFTALAASAGKAQLALAPLRATTTTLEGNFGKLNKGINQMARELPLGNAGARELVTTITKLGVATKNNERTVIELGKSYAKLGGATGESPAALAAGMTQLARVTNSGFDPKRITAIGDALTTVAAKSGASATGILGFSRLIAPLASASGVGATKILGISAAFSKLGDDGALGANAFNKMMGDLNKAVRDGSPMLANYASIVGKTQSQFAALAKTDPTEAITQITEAVARAGANGPRILESLNLEGPRTMRVFQGLSASGGIRQSVADATGAYGNNATEKASKEAFHGLIDESEKFGTALSQVTVALGGPFLGMLTRTVKTAGYGLSGIRGLAESGPVQGILKAFAAAAIPALLAMKLLGGGIKAAFAGQVATSSPVRAFLGGFAGAREAGPLGTAAGQTWMGRLGGNQWNDLPARIAATAHLADGDPRKVMAPSGMVGRVAGYAASTGKFLGGAVTGERTLGTGGFLQSLRGAGVAGLAAYMTMNSETSRLAKTELGKRTFGNMTQGLGQAGLNFRTSMEYAKYLREDGTVNNKEMRALQRNAARMLISETGQMGKMQAAGMLTKIGGQMVYNTGAAGLSAVASGGAKVMGALGGPVGLGLTAAMVGAQIKMASNRKEDETANNLRNAGDYIDKWRVAMGKATEATTTFAGALAKAGGAGAPGEKLSVSQVQEAAARSGKKGRVQNFTGRSIPEIAAEVRLRQRSGGVTDDDLNAIESDLFNSGFTAEQVKVFRKGVNAGGGDLSTSAAEDVGGVSRDAAGGKGRRGAVLGNLAGAWNHFARARVPGIAQDRTDGTIDTLSKDQTESAQTLVAGITQRYGSRQGLYGSTKDGKSFARGEEFKEIDEAIAAAYQEGNVDYAERLQKNFTDLSGLKKQYFDQTVIQEGGGFTSTLAKKDKTFREGIYQEGKDAPTSGQLKPGSIYDILKGQNNPLASLFDQRNTSNAAKAVQNVIGPDGKPEDPKAQLAAVNSVLAAQSKAGQGLEAMVVSLAAANNALSSIPGAASQLAAALSQAAQVRLSTLRSEMSSSELTKSRIREATHVAAIAPLGQLGQQQRDTSEQTIRQAREDAITKAQERVSKERELQVQMKRNDQDFKKSMEYAEKDYELQVFRMTDQYRRSRLYAQKDFNKSMRRLAEDGAKSMYDPYQRIQAKPIWDAGNLKGNLEEQNAAIANQLSNLKIFRKQGGNSNLIKMLGLNDPNNAQQLAQLVDDAANDPAVLASMNKTANARLHLSGSLSQDKDSTTFGRAKEDYLEGQRRGDEAFNISLNQMRENQEIAVERATEANTRSITRLKEDVKRADEEITRDLGKLNADIARISKGQIVDFKGQINSTLQGTVDVINAFGKGGEFQKALDGLQTAGIQFQLQTFQPAPALAGATPNGAQTNGNPLLPSGLTNGSDGPGMGYQRQESIVRAAFPKEQFTSDLRPNARTSSGGLSYHALGRAVDMAPSMAVFNWLAANFPNSTELIYTPAGARQIKNGGGHTYGGEVAEAHYDHIHWAMAKGGIATRATRALIGEAGSAEAVIPLDARGVSAMAQAMKRYIAPDDARSLKASAGVTYVTYDHSSTHNDHRTIIEHVNIKAETPRELVAEAAKIAARANLTAPATSRR